MKWGRQLREPVSPGFSHLQAGGRARGTRPAASPGPVFAGGRAHSEARGALRPPRRGPGRETVDSACLGAAPSPGSLRTRLPRMPRNASPSPRHSHHDRSPGAKPRRAPQDKISLQIGRGFGDPCHVSASPPPRLARRARFPHPRRAPGSRRVCAPTAGQFPPPPLAPPEPKMAGARFLPATAQGRGSHRPGLLSTWCPKTCVGSNTFPLLCRCRALCGSTVGRPNVFGAHCRVSP